MTDPERFSRKPSGELARLLLAAGAAERPSMQARHRALEVAVAAAAGATAASASAAATSTGVKLAAAQASSLASGTAIGGAASAPASTALGLGVLAKWFALGALGGVLALPLARVVMPEPSTPARQGTAPDTDGRASRPGELTSRAARSSPSGAVPAPATTSEPEPASEPRTPQATAAAQPSVHATSAAGGPAAAALSVPRESALLAAEVRFVERGRTALQQGAFDEALAKLAPYERDFPKQQLFTEVLFLRMEAFSRSGDATRARELALRVLTRGVAGPQAARAREVLGR